MNDRAEFERRFQVPQGVQWIDEDQGYRIVSDDDYWFEAEGQAHFRGFLGQWIGWQSARAQGGDVEPVAWWDGDLEEISSSFERHQTAYHTIPVYDHPAPTGDSGKAKLREQLEHERRYSQGLEKRIQELESAPTGTVPEGLPWISVEDRLPAVQRRTRRNRNGVLIMHDNGNVSHITEVTEALIAYMKNGPRQPTKFEASKPARILFWLYVDDNSPLPTAPAPSTTGGVPEGWKLVPVEPTGLMQVSARESLWIPHKGYPVTRTDVQKIWGAMLNVSPLPQPAQDREGGVA